MFEPEFHPRPLVRLLNTSWPLFRAFRVNVRVSWTIAIWPIFFFLALHKWLPAGEAILWGVVWTVALFTTTWTHEMGHIVMGRRCGIETERMTLRGLGGLAHLEANASSPGDEIRIALAGPATHLVWLAVLFPLTTLLRANHEYEVWFWMLDGFTRTQLYMMGFNLLPVWPLDGGRILRGMLATRMEVTRAAWHVSTVGLVGNGVFVAAGLLSWVTGANLIGTGRFGFLLAWIGLEGITACRRLRLEAKYGDVYDRQDPFQKVLMASQAALREGDHRERKERERAKARRERRRQLEETVDRLLERVSALGGVERLSRSERKALERASRDLAKEREGSP